MKFFIVCTATAVAGSAFLLSIVADRINSLERRLDAQSPVINTITVTGSDPSAPIPVSVTLQTHTDGRVTWKRP